MNSPYMSAAVERNWYPVPARGKQITVLDKSTGVESPATVIDAYHAASGRTCSLYSEPDGIPGRPAGLACRNEDRWVNIPFIVNPDARPVSG